MKKTIVRNPAKKRKTKKKTASRSFGYGGGVRGVKINPEYTLFPHEKKVLNDLKKYTDRAVKEGSFLRVELSLLETINLSNALSKLRKDKII